MFRLFSKWGVAAKAALMICALDMFYISTMQIINQQRLSALLVEQELSEMEAEALKTSDILASKIKTMRHDVMVLASMPPIQGIYRAIQGGGIDPLDGSSVDNWKTRLKAIFIAMQRIKPNYIEISYVRVNDVAEDLVHVKQLNTNLTIDQALVKLTPQTIYLSAIKQTTLVDQNIQHDTSIIQGISPVYDTDQGLFGYITILLNLNNEFAELVNTLDEGRTLLIADGKGDLRFVSHSDNTGSFDSVKVMQNVFPEIFETNGQSTLTNNTTVMSDVKGRQHAVSLRKYQFDPDNPKHEFWLTLTTPYDQIISLTSDMRYQSLVYGGVFLSVSIILSLLLSNQFTKSLRYITKAVKDFENNRTPVSLPIDRQDEIGILARAFDDFIKTSKIRNQQIEDEIAERKQFEAALLESDKTFCQVIDHIGQLLWMCSAQGEKVLYLSPAYEQIWGRSSTELYDNPELWMQAIHPDDRKRVTHSFATKALQGLEYAEDYRIVRPDGELRWVHDHAFPIHDVNGKLKNIAGFAQDITESKNVEEERRLSQKLEAVGQLAAGIAHEINTPTQYVNDNTRFLQISFAELIRVYRSFESLLHAANTHAVTEELISQTEALVAEVDLEYLIKEIPQSIDETLEGIQQISSIVKAMKDFSHPGGEDRELADINQIIQNTLTVSRNEWKYVAKIETDLAADMPMFLCFPQLISQVMLNLIVNASHAIKESLNENVEQMGTIKIITRFNRETIEILISDTGTGIKDSIREKIFDPFFTTKEVGIGTGQGLAFVRSAIIDRHFGSINVDSKIGLGTTFMIAISRICVSTTDREEVA